MIGAWRRVGVAVVVLCSVLVSVPVRAGADSYGPVTRSETLWAVARKVVQQQGGGNAAQMAWALYQANPAAFDGAPGKIKAGAVLAIPGAAAVAATPPAQAYARLTGKAAAPAPAAQSAAAVPTIGQVELQPRAPDEPHQWLAVTGSGFAPGAMLEFRDAAGDALPAGKPQSIREGRIEYAGVFPQQAARWEVVVRNADGRRSEPYELVLGAPAVVASPALPSTGGFAGSAEAQALRESVRAQRPADERYALLAPLEERYAGDVDFDYALGVAALDSGRYSEAVFVLQRAVASRPRFAGARMELARAYYALGDNESARREFTTLQQDDPPPEARRAIAQYLDAIDDRAVSYESQRGLFAELASGYDSNANGAPDIQNFIGFTLDSRNQSTASSYYGLGLGGALSHPFAPAWRAVGSGLATYRSNPDASFVDSQVVRLGGGLEWRPGRWTVALLPNGTYAMLDGEENHQVVAADGSAAFGLEDAQVALNLRYAQQRYTDALSVQDIDTLLYGVSTQLRLRALPRLQLGAALTAGGDEAVEAFSPFGRDLLGFRASALVDLGAGNALTLSLATLESDFDGRFFGEPRTDEQLSAALAYEWGAWRATGWSFRIQASYVDNSSTVALYDYDRLDAGLALRREFK